MTQTNNIASFVLRFTQDLWQDGDGEPHVRWRGHIRHVQGDEEDRFTEFSEAVAFIQKYLTQMTFNTLSTGTEMNHDSVLQESIKLWEQFAVSYTDMMLKTMEQTVKQSHAFKDQVEEAQEQAMKAWSFPPSHPQQKESPSSEPEVETETEAETPPPEPPPPTSEETQIIEILKQMQTQMQTLTERVEAVEKTLKQERESSTDP